MKTTSAPRLIFVLLLAVGCSDENDSVSQNVDASAADGDADADTDVDVDSDSYADADTNRDGKTDILSDAVWQENFVAGDIPAGRYRVVTRIDGVPVARFVEVFEGTTTFVELAPPESATPQVPDAGGAASG